MLTRLDLTTRPYADGQTFGPSGAFEELAGIAHFAADARHPRNARITDLELAPADAAGRVHFECDIRILRPADAGAGNRRLILDVPNRGNPIALRNTDLRTPGWLLQLGYTVVTCGWQHNVPTGTERLGLRAPEALDNGARLTGQVRSVQQVNVPTPRVGVADEPSGAIHTPYAAAVGAPATLTEFDYPLAVGRPIASSQWRFVDPATIEFDAGFRPGAIYELIYTAVGAPVTGLGFIALRDIASHLRFDDRRGIEFVIAFGTSQTGRLMRHMLYEGLCIDEHDRLVFDGVLTSIAGPLRSEANWRFGQPSFIGSDSPGFAPPFDDVGLLARLDHYPKVMHVNTSAEYSNLATALIHLHPSGSADADMPDHVRLYHMAGTHHGGGVWPLSNRLFDSRATYFNNSVDYKPLLRALVRNLDAWATEGQAPPPSRIPRLGDGTLVSRNEARTATAHLPGPGMPKQRLYPTQRLDYGPDAESGRARFPARDLGSYPDLVPAVDDDGSDISGIRHPDVAVPLATYTGWNPRHPAIGGARMNLLLNGATIPFTREAITARYPSRSAYVDRLREAAAGLVAERYLLAEDVDAIAIRGAEKFDVLSNLSGILPE